MLEKIQLNHHVIGHNAPAFLVAEIGINHNGNMELAKKTILAAKESGADAVKFQNYQTEDFLLGKQESYEYISQGVRIKESQFDMFKRYEFSEHQFQELKLFCDEHHLEFHATPSSARGINFLKNIGTRVLKNGSDFLTNLTLIEHMGKSGVPTVLSTGMATTAEIDDAVRTFRQTGNNQLILLHCTSLYPPAPEDVHLNKINTLRATFGTLVGFSDHTYGVWAACASLAFGAVWIEKHFTLDKTLPGPDHQFSMCPTELKQLVEGVRFTEKALGTSVLTHAEPESYSRKHYRLSCCATRDLAAGHIITAEDFQFSRPGYGVPPKNAPYLIGRCLKKAVQYAEPISLEHLS